MSNLLDYLPDIWVVLGKRQKTAQGRRQTGDYHHQPPMGADLSPRPEIASENSRYGRNFVTNQDIINLLELHDF